MCRSWRSRACARCGSSPRCPRPSSRGWRAAWSPWPPGRGGDRHPGRAPGIATTRSPRASSRSSRTATACATMTRGDGFGEIALLRDVPRTATVRSLTGVHLYALDKATFLEVVTGHPATVTEASAIAGERLGPRRPAAGDARRDGSLRPDRRGVLPHPPRGPAPAGPHPRRPGRRAHGGQRGGGRGLLRAPRPPRRRDGAQRRDGGAAPPRAGAGAARGRGRAAAARRQRGRRHGGAQHPPLGRGAGERSPRDASRRARSGGDRHL